MSKINLPPIPAGNASTQALNARFNAIATAINNTLSRDGSLPNSMAADLDMDSNDILNVGVFEANAVRIAGQELDISGLQNLQGVPVGVPAGGVQGQYLMKNSATDFDTRWVDLEIPDLPPAPPNGEPGECDCPPVFINVKDYGATGDGTTNDAAAVQAAINYAKSVNGTVFFPHGEYNVAGLATQNGRVYLYGLGDVLIKGTIAYQDNMPTSAATATPNSHYTPFFWVKGLSFKPVGAAWGLDIRNPFFMDFYQVCHIEECKFYGQNGIFLRQVVTGSFINLYFHTTGKGVEGQATTNCTFIGCKWHNQGHAGVLLIPDTETGQPGRFMGGEGNRFTSCEWMVNSVGLYMEGHAWGIIDSCMFDYCGTPLLINGNYGRMVVDKTYFGVADVPKNYLQNNPGYVAAAGTGLAVWGYYNPTLQASVGGHFSDCQFLGYPDIPNNTTQPLVYLTGSGTFFGAEDISFYGCEFRKAGNPGTQTHAAPWLLEITHAQMVRVISNNFSAFQQSTTLTDGYVVTDSIAFLGHSNINWQLRNIDNEIVPLNSDTAIGGSGNLPAGGATGHVLTKNSGADFDASWQEPTGGGGGNQVPAVCFASSSTAVVNTTNNYMAATGMTVTVTPQTTSEKIKLDMSPYIAMTTTGDPGGAVDVRLRRTIAGAATTTVAEWRANAFGLAQPDSVVGAVGAGGNLNLMFVDSPNTTSACTYFLEFKPFRDVYTLVNASYNGSTSGTRLSTMSCMRCV